MHSSSGGVFIALAREVLAWGGVAFGAVFDENYEVKITYSETLEGVRSMMGSKYLRRHGWKQGLQMLNVF